ncbi:uncharacterized protein CFAP97D2-like [Centruroides vittatus]|uniref:uncharacterized protein CFAP97D2-like n=1 Tax=Centruroides vittatus TaxID=120091 RepID=UPI00350FDFB9
MQKPNNTFSSPNKFLQKRWQEDKYRRHLEKLHNAQPVVDTRAPSDYFHIHVKLRNLKLQEERNQNIEKENSRLLNQMATIMKNGGRVDCKNKYVVKSLNETKRKKEKERIEKENQRLLLRISHHSYNQVFQQLQKTLIKSNSSDIKSQKSQEEN